MHTFCEYVPAYVQARAGLEASVLMYRPEQALKLLCSCTGVERGERAWLSGAEAPVGRRTWRNAALRNDWQSHTRGKESVPEGACAHADCCCAGRELHCAPILRRRARRTVLANRGPTGGACPRARRLRHAVFCAPGQLSRPWRGIGALSEGGSGNLLRVLSCPPYETTLFNTQTARMHMYVHVSMCSWMRA